MFYIVFDFGMVLIFTALGVYFYRSQGKAVRFLTGYQGTIRSQEYENQLTKTYGKRFICMGAVFILGLCIDVFYEGIGCLISWGIWAVLFVLLLAERTRKEKRDEK